MPNYSGGGGGHPATSLTSDTASTAAATGGASGGGGGGGGGSGGGGGGPAIPPGALSNSPYWQIESGYLNSTSALDTATLQRMIDLANSRYGLSSQEIANNLQNAQRNVTYDLANRQATESGDTAFYHNQASLLASFQSQGAQLDLQDYLAGAQAAYQQQMLDINHSLSSDWLTNYQQMVQYYTALAGGGAATPPPPPQPGGGGQSG